MSKQDDFYSEIRVPDYLHKIARKVLLPDIGGERVGIDIGENYIRIRAPTLAKCRGAVNSCFRLLKVISSVMEVVEKWSKKKSLRSST